MLTARLLQPRSVPAGGEGPIQFTAAVREIRPRVTQTPLVGGAQLYELPRLRDGRGQVSFAEINQALPFPVVRYSLVFGVPSRKIRGESAHRRQSQFLICVHGSCSVRLFDGEAREDILLNRPDLGIHIPPLVWTTQSKCSPDAVMLAFASDIYREQDYIRDLDEYLMVREERPPGPAVL